MKKLKYALTNHLEGLQEEKIDYTKYETSFRRWLVNEIDFGRMTVQEAKIRFKMDSRFHAVYNVWQKMYSSQIQLSLQAMTSEERTKFEALEKRNRELEDQLERSQIKNVLTEAMIDIAEKELKIDIRKKSGPKQ